MKEKLTVGLLAASVPDYVEVIEEVTGVLRFINVERLEWRDPQQKLRRRWTTVHLGRCEQVKSNPTKTPKTPEGRSVTLILLQRLPLSWTL